MCGRYTITLEPADIEAEMGVAEFPADFEPRYNVAPTQPVLVVRDLASRKVEWMKWGLIPFWAKDPSIGARLINARSETLAEKPSFKQSFARRRCLILADGFFEWQKVSGEASMPYYLRLKSAKPFAFAGLWDQWKSPENKEVLSCTIITCAPNELVAPIHDRMPVMLDRNKAWQWLQPAEVEELEKQLLPYPAEEMQAYRIGKSINNTRLDTPELLRPV
jgi:putative SOS response-associated peptidase YedK